VSQTGTNTSHEESFTRSATAPEMSATVMAANVSWNRT
jgi:hypothetical protein